jgi:hypothetical protein
MAKSTRTSLISRLVMSTFREGLFVQPQRSPSAAAEERSDEGTASKRSALAAAVGCKAWFGTDRPKTKETVSAEALSLT